MPAEGAAAGSGGGGGGQQHVPRGSRAVALKAALLVAAGSWSEARGDRALSMKLKPSLSFYTKGCRDSIKFGCFFGLQNSCYRGLFGSWLSYSTILSLHSQ